jgi:hypothetical protein
MLLEYGSSENPSPPILCLQASNSYASLRRSALN